VPKDLHATRLAVLGQFRMVIKSIRRHYAEVQRRSDISGAHLWALAHVAQHPGGRVGDVARALAIHPSTASNLIRALASRGMIVQRRKGDDGRTVQLFPDRKGTTALRRAPKPLIGVLQQALADLPERSVHALHRHLDELLAVMESKDRRARAQLLARM
jgi:DNA-binding MarR family transcriptional regulator